MPNQDDAQALERARQDQRQGKAPTTQAGEFIREEMQHIREGKHGARSPQQAIAIGLSKARRAGVDLPPPGKGKASARTRASAKREYQRGQESPGLHEADPKRSRAAIGALKREGRSAASPAALSDQASQAAARRSPAERSAAARKASATKGPAKRSAAAQKAARSRARDN